MIDSVLKLMAINSFLSKEKEIPSYKNEIVQSEINEIIEQIRSERKEREEIYNQSIKLERELHQLLGRKKEIEKSYN